ncbi:hypothetical protein [Dyella sp.]|uniref:sulfotransferase family protein n=1 Tax=Dyella sp. TaxID=1869338 RepID=UPI002FD9BCCC
MNNKKRLILVIGMHRSGTSAITRGLKALGVELGESLLQPGPLENPRGFWEDKDIVELNRELLEALSTDWCSVADIDRRSLPADVLESFLARAAELLNQKLETRAIWAFKDPRTTRLLWFWKQVIERIGVSDVNYVLCLRNPLAVSDSLFIRNGIDRATSILLWGVYTVEALQQIDTDSSVVIDYDQLLENGREVLSQLATTMHLPWAVGRLEEEYFSEFLTFDLRHNKYELDELRDSGLADPAIVQLYAEISRAALTGGRLDSHQILPSLEMAAEWLKGIAALRTAMDRMEADQHKESNTHVMHSEFERTEMFRLECDRLRERNGELEGHLSELEHLRSQAEMFRLECDRLRDRNGELDGQLIEQRSSTEKLRNDFEALIAESASEKESHIKMACQNAALMTRVVGLRAARSLMIDHFFKDLAVLRATVDRLESQQSREDSLDE